MARRGKGWRESRNVPRHVCPICERKTMTRIQAHTDWPELKPGKCYTFCDSCRQVSVGHSKALGSFRRIVSHAALSDKTRGLSG